MAPRRIGGQATLPSGEAITWTSAEGARGTRWREAVTRDGRLLRSVLLEVSATGRPARLELTTAAGLLTLHPEADQSALHGNVVGDAGVRHLALEWSAAHELLVAGSPAAASVAVWRQVPHIAVGGTAALDVVWIDDALDPRPGRWTIARIGQSDWRLQGADGSAGLEVHLDPGGVPVLPGAVGWPLEA